MERKTSGKKISVLLLLLISLISIVFVVSNKNSSFVNSVVGVNPELAVSRTYEQFIEGDEKVDGTDNVEFSAFFLRDLDQDGYAEKVKGTCRKITENDNLYMELAINMEGYLKGGKIQIAGTNMIFGGSFPKDNEFKYSYSGNNIKIIEFEDMYSGTQKLLIGSINTYIGTGYSGSERNINNYSRKDNKIIFTGIYVDDEGNEIEIRKEINLTVDWHGTAKTLIDVSTQRYEYLDKMIDTENGILRMNPVIVSEETKGELMVKSNYLSGYVPEFNGYKPIEVTCTSVVDGFSYDEETGFFEIVRNARIDEDGNLIKSVSKKNSYTLNIKYPLESFDSLKMNSTEIIIPVQSYYECFNNNNEGFQNPYKSNVVSTTIDLVYCYKKESAFSCYMDNVATTSANHYEHFCKMELTRGYYGMTEEIKNDHYWTVWSVSSGGEFSTDVVISQRNDIGELIPDYFDSSNLHVPMDQFVTITGLFFENYSESFLNENDCIKIYDEETNDLLASFNYEDLKQYSSIKPYILEHPVKYIRAEIIGLEPNKNIRIMFQKEIDNEYIFEHFTEEEYQSFNKIVGHAFLTTNSGKEFAMLGELDCDMPTARCLFSVQPNRISTQDIEEKISFKISVIKNTKTIGWTDGVFLIKIPEDVLKININGVNTNNTNVNIDSYEVFEKENERFIKIYTSSINGTEEGYDMYVICDIALEPDLPNKVETFSLYAKNDYYDLYEQRVDDIYDIDNDGDVSEKVIKAIDSISVISPNSLLTSQTIYEIDDQGTIIKAPNIWDYEPSENGNNTARVGINITNNYMRTISEVVIIGKIPFKNNTFAINNKDLKSEFDTVMLSDGIEAPEEIRDEIDIYYSTKENPTKDKNDEANGWIKGEDVEDWSQIKTYLIDLGEVIIGEGVHYSFSYKIAIPRNVSLNKITYCNFGVYFCLNTVEGKYRTKCEPNKIGIRITKKYDFEITKYQKNQDRTIEGIVYKLSELDSDDIVQNNRTGVTNSNGKILFDGLCCEKEYELREIKTLDDYELSEDVIRFVAHFNGDTSVITFEKLEGNIRGNITSSEGENYREKIAINLEDEVNARLRIVKTDKETEELLKGVKFKFTSNDSEAVKVYTTNVDGEIFLKGLKIDTEYYLEEIKAEGHYLNDILVFKVVNDNGDYKIIFKDDEYIEDNAEYEEFCLNNNIKEINLDDENGIPTFNMELLNESYPKYNLVITKIKKVEEKELSGDGTVNDTEEIEYLQGAKFKLLKDDKELGIYVTDENGRIEINDLYQYEDDRKIDQTYVLREIEPPSGFVKISEIVFSAQKYDGNLELDETVKFGNSPRKYTVDGNTINLVVEDLPIFKLVKKDSETGELLPNVKFAIYNITDGETPAKDSKGNYIGNKETINGNDYYVVTTDLNGEFTVDLAEGLYKAVELVADEKYDLSESTYYFGIGTTFKGKNKGYIDWVAKVSGVKNILSMKKTTNNEILVVGSYRGRLDLGNGVVLDSDKTNGFIAKYDPDGIIIWAKDINAEGNSEFDAVSELSDGSIVVGGGYSGNVTVGDYSFQTSNSYNDAILIRYSSEGNVLWARKIAGSNGTNDNVVSVCGTEDGGFLTVTKAYGSVSVDGINVNGDTSYQLAVIKFTYTNQAEWASSVKGYWGNQGYNINSNDCAIQTQDGGYVIGGTVRNSGMIFEDFSLRSYYRDDGFIVKLSNEGRAIWGKMIGNDYEDSVKTISEMENGDILVGGSAQNEVFINNESVGINGSYPNAFIARFGEDGTFKNFNNVKSYRESAITNVEATSDGGYIATGYFNSSVLGVGNYSLYNTAVNNSSGTASFSHDGMLIKYTKDDEVDWATSVDHNGTDRYDFVFEQNPNEFIVAGKSETDDKFTFNDSISFDSISSFLVKYKTKLKTTIEYKKAYNYLSETSVNKLINTSDGGYIMIGSFSDDELTNINGVEFNDSQKLVNHVIGDIYGNNTTYGKREGYIVKFDKTNRVEWTKCIGGMQDDEVIDIIETKDRGLLVSALFYSGKIVLDNGIEVLNNSDLGIEDEFAGGDALLIKYNSQGNIQWARSIGGTDYSLYEFDGYDYITNIVEAPNGDIIVAGNYSGETINFENDIVLESHNKNAYIRFQCTFVIKLDKDGEVKWAKNQHIENSLDEFVISLGYTADGGCLVGTASRNDYNYQYQEGKLVKYDANGNVQWERNNTMVDDIVPLENGDYLLNTSFIESSYALFYYSEYRYGHYLEKYNSNDQLIWKSDKILLDIKDIFVTKDGGFLGAGSTNRKLLVTADGEYIGNPSENGAYESPIMAKYNSTGNLEWATSIGSNRGKAQTIIQLLDGTYLMSLDAIGSNYYVEDGNLKSNSGSASYAVINFIDRREIEEQQELEVNNKRKEYKISTSVEKIDGVKGGSVSGDYLSLYETVKYDDSNTKPIIITPNQDYEIIGITVNGSDWSFEPNDDGTYTMPTFENIKENIHIAAKFSLKDNKITINKKDSISNEPLSNCEIAIDQIEERENPDANIVIGDLIENNTIYYVPDKTNEISNVVGNLVNNGDYYFVENENTDGSISYVPTNSRTYQLANGGTAGFVGTASSYIPINLEGLDGGYIIQLNARASCNTNDRGFAGITESTDQYLSNNQEGRIVTLSGTYASTATARNYYSKTPIEGGRMYYLHLGYFKNSVTYAGTDEFVVNSIKVYKATEKSYNFIKNDEGEYISTNSGANNTKCISFLPINLTNYYGKYNILMDLETVSDVSNDYATVDLINNPEDQQVIGSIGSLYGNSTATEMKKEVDGGQLYYLRMTYNKSIYDSETEEKAVISNLRFEPSESDLYHTTVKTNSNGQAITQIPFGKYTLTEKVAPEGYYLLENSVEIEFRSYDGAPHEFELTNEKISKVIVHHYKKGTEEKVADDEIIQGKSGTKYETYPNININGYELEVVGDDIIVPSNRNGVFEYEDQEVIYYYVPKKMPVIVNHYIENTNDPVLLKDGTFASTEILNGNPGEEYATYPINDELLDDSYELATIPENAEGDFSNEVLYVTYEYKKVSREFIINKVDKDTQEPLENVKFDIYENEIKTIEPEDLINIGSIYYERVGEKGEEVDATIECYNSNNYNNYSLFNNQDDKWIAENCKWYINNFGNLDPKNTSNVNVNVDLYDFVGEYVFSFDAKVENGLNNNFNFYSYDVDVNESEYGDFNKNYQIILEGGREYRFYIYYNTDLANVSNDYCEISNFKVNKAKNTQTIMHYGIEYSNDYSLLENEIVPLNVELVDVIGLDYSFVEQDGKYIPENCQKYANDNSLDNQSKTEAGSHFEIDLTGYEGTYGITFDALMNNCESNDSLYCWVHKENGDYIDSITLFGEENGVDENCLFILNGGSKYYFEMSYYKDSSTDVEDYVEVSNIRICACEKTEYGFVKTEDGKYISNNQGVYGSIVHSVIPIDLTNSTETVKLTVNAEISSGEDYDFGELIVTDSIDKNKSKYAKKLATLSGEVEAQDYSINLFSGKKYYLHLIYSKAWFNNYDPKGDTFTINSVKLDTSANREVTTDSNGIARIELPVGEYRIVEKTALDGYIPLNEEIAYVVTKNGNNEIVVENEKGKGEVIVHHYIENTEIPIRLTDGTSCQDEIKRNVIGEMYATKPREDIDPMYTFVSTEGETSGEYIDGVIEVTYYYGVDPDKDKDVSYTINYYKDDVLAESQVVETTIKVLETEIPVDKDGINIVDMYPGYELDEDATVIPDTIEDGGVINVYYKAKDAKLIIHYKEKGNEEAEPLRDDEIIDTKYNEKFDLGEYAFDIEGYLLDEEFQDEEITISEDTVERTIYYVPKSKVVVHHMERDEETGTDTEIGTDEIEGPVGKTITIHPKDYPGYVIVERPENESIEITKEVQDVYYYYKKAISGVIEKHIGRELEEQDNILLYEEYHSGESGTPYNIEPKEFLGYVLDEENLPDNSSGEMKENEVIEVRYYYNKATKVVVHYTYKDGDTEIDIEQEEISGYVGKEYTSEMKEYDDYIYVSSSDNISGTMTEDTIDVYYYYTKDTKVVVHYIERTKENNVVIEKEIETVEIKGEIGQDYESVQKEYDELEFKESSDNTSGKMTKEVIDVYYYYVKPAQVIVKYLNVETGEELEDPDEIPGYVGEEYRTTGKDINDYVLVEDTKNTEGEMGEETIEVIYYYAPKADVNVKYIDKDTGKEIAAEENIEGYVGKEYTTNKKTIKDYEFVEDTKNTSGKMKEKHTEVIYYYKAKEVPKPPVENTVKPDVPKEEPVQDTSTIMIVNNNIINNYYNEEPPKEQVVVITDNGGTRQEQVTRNNGGTASSTDSKYDDSEKVIPKEYKATPKNSDVPNTGDRIITIVMNVICIVIGLNIILKAINYRRKNR